MVLLQVMALCLCLSCTFLLAKYSASSEEGFRLPPRQFFREAALALAAELYRWVTEQPLLCFLVALFVVGAEIDPMARVILYTLQFTVLAALCMPVTCSLINDAIQRSEKRWAAISAAPENSADLQKSLTDLPPEVTGDVEFRDVSSETAPGNGTVQKVVPPTLPSGSPILSPPCAMSPKLHTLPSSTIHWREERYIM